MGKKTDGCVVFLLGSMVTLLILLGLLIAYSSLLFPPGRLHSVTCGTHYTTNWSRAAGDEKGGYIAELTSQPDGTTQLYVLDSAPPDDFVVDATGQMLPIVVVDPVVVSGQQVEKLPE